MPPDNVGAKLARFIPHVPVWYICVRLKDDGMLKRHSISEVHKRGLRLKLLPTTTKFPVRSYVAEK